MKFSILASGSKGNASLIYTDNTLIQIDMGVTLKMVDAELKRLGKSRSDIQGVFITHEHSDHISGRIHDRHHCGNMRMLPIRCFNTVKSFGSGFFII